MPNVQVKLHDRKVEENVDALLEGRLHLAFIFHAPKPGALRGLRFLPLSREHPRLAVSPKHRLARRRAVSLEEAAGEPFVGLVPEEFPDYHYFIDTVFASTKTKPQIVEERDSVDGIIAAVEAGSGVALAADRFAYVFGRRIKLLRLIPEPKTIDIGLAARKGPLSPAAETFWQCAKQAHSAFKKVRLRATRDHERCLAIVRVSTKRYRASRSAPPTSVELRLPLSDSNRTVFQFRAIPNRVLLLSLRQRCVLQDPKHLRDCLWIPMSGVTRRNNLLRFGSVEMRTPIGHDAVAAIRGIAASAIADDRVIRNAFRHWQCIHFLYERIVRRKGIDTVR